jgi:hypothetical protein
MSPVDAMGDQVKTLKPIPNSIKAYLSPKAITWFCVLRNHCQVLGFLWWYQLAIPRLLLPPPAPPPFVSLSPTPSLSLATP